MKKLLIISNFLLLLLFLLFRVPAATAATRCEDLYSGTCRNLNIAGINPCNAQEDPNSDLTLCPQQGLGTQCCVPKYECGKQFKEGVCSLNPCLATQIDKGPSYCPPNFTCCIPIVNPNIAYCIKKSTCDLWSGFPVPCAYQGEDWCCSTNNDCDNLKAGKPTSGGLISPYPTIDIHGKCGEDITTALGCVPIGKFEDFVAWLLKRVIGISGGIAFLLMVFGGLKILTSAGDPKGIQAGGEMISSALIGLLFIIFSVFLLELIGVKILGIPGL